MIARYTRASMLGMIRMDFVRTARAKGLAERSVILRHALQNALIPVVTVSGLALADLITGSFFVEAIYGVPGIGRYFVSTVVDKDYPVLMAVTLALRGADLVDELPRRRHLCGDRPTGEGELMAAPTLASGVGLPVRRARSEERGFWRDAWGRLRLNKAAMAGLVVILLLITLAILAPLLSPYDYADGNLLHRRPGTESRPHPWFRRART